MEIRRFQPGDENEAAAIIQRCLKEVNTEDPQWENDWLSERYTPDFIREMAKTCHTYVICDRDQVVATGTIKIDENAPGIKQSEIVSCFIRPEYIGKGLGRMLFETLESDEYFRSAQRVYLTSSVMAQDFYEHMGYKNPNGHGVRNAETLLEYEKIPFSS